MAEDKKLSQLIINEMTKAQYDALNNINEDEIYILTDAENTVKTDTTSIVGDGSTQNPVSIAPAVLNKIDTEIAERIEKDSEIEQSLTTLTNTTTNHIDDKSNPHEVTKDQVGLGNVDNTSDLDKPISTATQTALNNKQNKLTAGTNIAISSDNVISATDTKYTAGTDITISNNVVSNKYPEVFLTQEEYDVLANNNQIDPNTYYNTLDTSAPLNIDDVILILPSLNEGDFLKQGTLAFVEV